MTENRLTADNYLVLAKTIQSTLICTGTVKSIRHMLDTLRARGNGKYYFSKNRLLPLYGRNKSETQIDVWGDTGISFLCKCNIEVEGVAYDASPNKYKALTNRLRRYYGEDKVVTLVCDDLVNVSLEPLVDILISKFKDIEFYYELLSPIEKMNISITDERTIKEIKKMRTEYLGIGGAYVSTDDFIESVREMLVELDCYGLEEYQQEDLVDMLDDKYCLGFISVDMLLSFEQLLTIYDEDRIQDLYEEIMTYEYEDEEPFVLAMEKLVKTEYYPYV